jgi:hypothetical protein
MNLTNQQIIQLSDAIGALDGQNVTQLIEGKPVAVARIPRLTHSGRWALARNAGRLESAVADFNRARSALIRQHSGGDGAISPAHPAFNAFAGDFEKLNQQPVELDLDRIGLADLRLEENENSGNPIPIQVLKLLAPVIQLPEHSA